MPITTDAIEQFKREEEQRVSANPSQIGLPDINLEENRQNFSKAFPHLSAFTEGVTDAVSLGMVKPTQKRDFLSTEGAAETAGMILGEIPFWLTGGIVAKKLIGVAAKAADAGRMSAAFGKTVKIAKRHGTEVGEAAGAIGVTAGRAAVSDDPRDDITPFGLAIDVTLPFAMSAVKLGKRFGERKKELQSAAKKAASMQREHERFIRNAHSTKMKVHTSRQEDLDATLGPIAEHEAKQADLGVAFKAPLKTSQALDSAQEHARRQQDLDDVFDAMDPEDVRVLKELEDLFTLTSGDEAHIESILGLYRQGAPIQDLLNLNHADDIADYLQLQRTYPINRPAIQGWEEMAKRRKDSDMLIVKELVIGRMRPLKNVHRPIVEGAEDYTKKSRQNETDANLRQLESRMNAETGLIDVDMVRCPRK